MNEKAYLLGIFDSEGSISAYQQRGRWALFLSATMASEDVMRMFQQHWGGGVHRRTRLTIGGLRLWQWYLSASKALPFLRYLARHSKTKRRHADIAIILAEQMRKYSHLGYRKGIALSAGKRVISPKDQAKRSVLVMKLRALNGARSRFDSLVTTT